MKISTKELDLHGIKSMQIFILMIEVFRFSGWEYIRNIFVQGDMTKEQRIEVVLEWIKECLSVDGVLFEKGLSKFMIS